RRQEGDETAVALCRRPGVQRPPLGQHVGVGDLDALGRTGGARCVDEREQIVGGHRAGGGLGVEAAVAPRGEVVERRGPLLAVAALGGGAPERGAQRGLVERGRPRGGGGGGGAGRHGAQRYRRRPWRPAALVDHYRPATGTWASASRSAIARRCCALDSART